MFGGKLLILSDIIYFTWRARNVKIFEEVVWPASVCARMIMDDCRRQIGLRVGRESDRDAT